MMRVLSGIQPSGKLHIGNYFGMMKPAIELQEKGEAFLFIANYHALTSVQDPARLRADTHAVALDFLACGLDPSRTVFFRQSDVPEVTELMWLLSTVTPMGLPERCHSYKDKLARGLLASHALFSYPVLMAADILAVQATIVPVGRDQKQHVEVTRDIAIKFNQQFGDVFTIPEPSIREEVAVVPGIDGQKMSKSYGNTIPMFADSKELKQRIMAIKTDSKPLDAPKDPDSDPVFALYKLFATPQQQHDLAEKYRAGGFGYGHAKLALLELAEDHFAPRRQRYEELLADPAELERLLAHGARRARHVAEGVLTRLRAATGLPHKPGRSARGAQPGDPGCAACCGGAGGLGLGVAAGAVRIQAPDANGELAARCRPAGESPGRARYRGVHTCAVARGTSRDDSRLLVGHGARYHGGSVGRDAGRLAQLRDGSTLARAARAGLGRAQFLGAIADCDDRGAWLPHRAGHAHVAGDAVRDFVVSFGPDHALAITFCRCGMRGWDSLDDGVRHGRCDARGIESRHFAQ